MLKILHKHLNSPNFCRWYYPHFTLGVVEAERAGNVPAYRPNPFHLASLNCPSSLSLSYFTLNVLESPRKNGRYVCF